MSCLRGALTAKRPCQTSLVSEKAELIRARGNGAAHFPIGFALELEVVKRLRVHAEQYLPRIRSILIAIDWKCI